MVSDEFPPSTFQWHQQPLPGTGVVPAYLPAKSAGRGDQQRSAGLQPHLPLSSRSIGVITYIL